MKLYIYGCVQQGCVAKARPLYSLVLDDDVCSVCGSPMSQEYQWKEILKQKEYQKYEGE